MKKKKPSGPPPKKPSPSAFQKKTLAERMEEWLEKRSKLLLLITLFISLIFSFLMFDIKMSEGNDDSEYIEGAYKFAKEAGSYFSSKAPLYPIILSIPVKFFGINVPLLKSLSVIFQLLQIVFLYAAFRKLIPNLILFFILIFIAINDYFQYFASQTYSESFFLFLLAIFFYSFRLLYENNFSTGKSEIKYWLLFGLLLFLLTLSRNIAIAAVPAVIIFFLLIKDFKALLSSIASFGLFRVAFEFIRKSVWGGNSQFASQIDILRQKDPYDASKGLDDLAGFFGRLTANTDLYLSKRFFQILGFISEDSIVTKTSLSILVIILFAIGVYFIFRNKNRPLLFTALYSIFFSGLTFFVLQTRWDQPRFILVCVPFLLMVIFYGFYFLTKKQTAGFIFIVIVPCSIIILSSFISSTKKSINNYSVVKENLKGDRYYGYTTDWQNFLKMSAWCADSLPAESYVASRKAPMSFIYSNGKSFYPVYHVFSTEPDTILSTFKRDGVTHIILASLRRNPKKQDGYIINTMHRLLQPVVQKYPNKVSFVKQIGETEPAYLYKLNY